MGELSRAMEDYLRVMRSLELRGGGVRSVDVAKELKVSRPSVHMAVSRLKEEGCLTHDYYTVLVLTEKGRAAADDLLARRRLAEILLARTAPADSASLEEELCAVEHSLSLRTLEALSNLIIAGS